MPYAHITGWGMSAPEGVLTNDDLSKLVDTNDQWIRERTGSLLLPNQVVVALSGVAATSGTGELGLRPTAVRRAGGSAAAAH